MSVEKFIKPHWVYYSILVFLLFIQSTEFSSYLGLSYENKLTIYQIKNFLTERGRFDDFYNTIYFAPRLPDPNSGYLVSTVGMVIGNFLVDKPSSWHVLSHAVFLGGSILILYRALSIWGHVWLAGTYPIIFAVSRSNFELLAGALVILALAINIKDVKNRPSKPILLILIAAVVKPTAILFVFLFPLKESAKRWKTFLAFGFLQLTLVYFVDANYTRFFNEYFASLAVYEIDYVIGGGGTLFNNSLWGLVKIIALSGVNDANVALHRTVVWLGGYNTFAIIGTVTFLLIAISSQRIETKYSVIAMLGCLVSPVAADYRLIYLLPILAFNSHCSTNPFEKAIFWCAFIIILPKHLIFVIQMPEIGHAFTLNSIVNPMLLITVVALILLKNNKNTPTHLLK